MTTAQRDSPTGAGNSANSSGDRWARLPGFGAPTAQFVYRWTIALLVANIGIVATGGAVRLTGSGLGCPTWPQCSDESYVPHAAMGIHGLIEFGNRMLAWVLVVIALAALLAVFRQAGSRKRDRVLVTLIAAGIPFQGVIGGITVLMDLNPWVVALHFLLSMGLISAATVLVFRIRPGARHTPTWSVQSQLARLLAWGLYGVTWATIYLGTVVTGSGPHAGDENSPRTGLAPETMTQMHAHAVFALIGVAAAITATAWVLHLPQLRATLVFVGLLVLQGLVGVVQYLTELPVALVLIHMVVSALLMVSATWLVLRCGPDRQPADRHHDEHGTVVTPAA